MSTHSSLNAFDPAEWISAQVARFGPVVGGKDLRSLLGFRTTVAFQKARQQGKVAVRVFALPDRLGTYAITEEVCSWVVSQRDQASVAQATAVSDGKGGAP